MSTKSGTGIFVASAIWAAAIVASAYLCSMLLSIPGAAGASLRQVHARRLHALL